MHRKALRIVGYRLWKQTPRNLRLGGERSHLVLGGIVKFVSSLGLRYAICWTAYSLLRSRRVYFRKDQCPSWEKAARRPIDRVLTLVASGRPRLEGRQIWCVMNGFIW